MRISLRCRSCHTLARILDNPYQYSGQVISKLCVSVATLIWSCIVLYKSDALAAWAGAKLLDEWIDEDALAFVLLVFSVGSIWRLFRHSAPLVVGSCVYGVFLILWLYTWATLVLAITSGITALRPGQFAGVTIVTALAMFAFISNQKRSRHGSPTN